MPKTPPKYGWQPTGALAGMHYQRDRFQADEDFEMDQSTKGVTLQDKIAKLADFRRAGSSRNAGYDLSEATSRAKLPYAGRAAAAEIGTAETGLDQAKFNVRRDESKMADSRINTMMTAITQIAKTDPRKAMQLFKAFGPQIQAAMAKNAPGVEPNMANAGAYNQGLSFGGQHPAKMAEIAATNAGRLAAARVNASGRAPHYAPGSRGDFDSRLGELAKLDNKKKETTIGQMLDEAINNPDLFKDTDEHEKYIKTLDRSLKEVRKFNDKERAAALERAGESTAARVKARSQFLKPEATIAPTGIPGVNRVK